MTLSGSNLKLDLEMVMLPQIPRIREGSGNLMGRVFLENPTLFLEMVALFWGQNGELLAAPESYLLPLLLLVELFID